MKTLLTNTLPAWMVAKCQSVDTARKVIRMHPTLKQLGTVFGPTKLYSEEEADQIVVAIQEYESKKRGAAPVTVG